MESSNSPLDTHALAHAVATRSLSLRLSTDHLDCAQASLEDRDRAVPHLHVRCVAIDAADATSTATRATATADAANSSSDSLLRQEPWRDVGTVLYGQPCAWLVAATGRSAQRHQHHQAQLHACACVHWLSHFSSCRLYSIVRNAARAFRKKATENRAK